MISTINALSAPLLSKNESGVTVVFQRSDSCRTQSSLIARARIREPEAWHDLVQLYGPLIASWCQRCGFDSHTAADCTQEVFSSVLRSLEKFEPRGESGSFRGWLWTITSNKIKDRIRIETRNVSAPGGSTALRSLGTVPDQLSLPDKEPTESIQISELVARALGQIQDEFAEKTWRIFYRSVIDDVPTAQIAEEFDISPATVRQSRSRILRRLRQHLGDFNQ